MTLFTTPELKAVWDEWKEYRVQEKRQRKYTQKGEQRAWDRLQRLSGGNDETAISILREAMELQYIGFFPLKKPVNATHKPSRAEIHAEGYKNLLSSYLPRSTDSQSL